MKLIIAFLSCFCPALVATAQADDLDIHAAMTKVESVLIANGFQAQGYAQTEPPLLRRVDYLSHNDWGHSVPGLMEISLRQPEGCMWGTLIHEVTHQAQYKFLLADNEPQLSAREMREQFEALADLVESEVVTEYLPNCERRPR